MNKRMILYLLTLFGIAGFNGSIKAQTFSGTENGTVPGSERGYYCADAGVSVAEVDLTGRIGDNYELTSVLVDITHEQPEELQLSLISPRGKIVNLSIGNGGSLDGAYTATVFTDAGGDISLTTPPFTGNFAPQGGALNDLLDGELVNGEWRLEVCDFVPNNRDGIINEFELVFDGDGEPVDDPVYDIQVAAITFTNVNLNDDCQRLITPRNVLAGNFDADGDGETPPDESFMLTILDDNPCNGPIIDGCGEFEFWISPKPLEPMIYFGFDECTGGDNILQITQVPDPASGQSASVTVTEDTITLRARGGDTETDPVFAQASYVFPMAGTAGFRLNFDQSTPSGMVLDIVRVSIGDIVTPVLTDFDVSGLYTFAQPIEVEDGDILQFELRNPDGRTPANSSESEVKVFDFFFQPTVADIPVTGPLPLGGFITASDATPVTFVEVPESPDNLYTSQLADVLVTSLPTNVSRSYRVDGPTGAVIQNSLDSALRARMLLGGGLPLTFDGCSDVVITVTDQITSAGNCRDIIVTRTFVAQDDPECVGIEGVPDAQRASYEIIFRRATLEDVVPPMSVVEVDCSDFNGIGNPQPILFDYPRLRIGEDEFIYLDETYDNLGVTFTDGPRINTCENTYKFVRTYTVVDWCDIDNVEIFNQLVKVGDFSAPMIVEPTQDRDFDGIPDEGPLFYSTNAANCTAFIDITTGVVINDECSAVTTLSALIFPNGDLDDLPLGPFNRGDVATNIPLGEHIVRYIANDACGNADTIDVSIEVGDASAPVAKCEDGLNISLGGAGTAILTADDVNVNSYDDCTSEEDLLLEVVRLDENNEPIGEWQTSFELDCSDLGMLRVGLRVTDDANQNGIPEPGIDNSNRCFTEILVEDIIAPICVAPASFGISCTDLEGSFPEDLEAAFANDPDATIDLLNDLFGSPTGIDNCPGTTVSQTVTDNRNECGAGLIVRRFGVEDDQGFTSLPNCNQTLSVVSSFDYSIVFPADEDNMNCVEPDYNGLQVVEGGCSMVTTTMNIDTFQASADECYILRITYEVIDLCEYSTEAPPYTVPRDADQDDNFGEGVVLTITPGMNDATLSDDVAILDTDLNRFNGFIDELDSGDGGLVDGNNLAGYGQDASRGAFIYQQFITVIDDTAPTVAIDDSNDTAFDMDGNCESDFTFDFAITDECSMDAVTTIVDLDLFVSDDNNDGSITPNEFNSNEIISGGDVQDIGEGTFRVSLTDLPIGRHAVRVRASDGCGNTQLDIFAFESIDSAIPAISCVNGLTATLSATEDGGAEAQISADLFVVDADNMNDCSGPLEYAIYRIEDAIGENFEPNADDDLLILNCDDLGVLGVRIYAIDGVGISSFCETTLSVQTTNENTCSEGNNNQNDNFTGLISGEVHTPSYQMQEGVEINVSANTQGDYTTYTGNQGTYTFRYLMEGDDYTVQPTANPAINLAAVTTGDLILISRHILALEHFSSPYQHVAADVTGDRTVNVLDMIAIRRVILGLATDFSNVNTWRFIAESHDFGDDETNWLGNNELMDVYNINNLEGEMINANFMAIEMGNVSAATLAGELMEPGAQRSYQALTIPVQRVNAGEIHEVSFYQPSDLVGFQTTLEMSAELELIELIQGTAGEGDFNLQYAAEGLLGIAHVSDPRGSEPLFTLRLRAQVDGQLSDFLRLSDRLVTTESYALENERPTTAGLQLDFKVAVPEVNSDATLSNFEVYQNRPNPFREETRVDFYLPEATEAVLTVQDLRGRTLFSRKIEGLPGNNTALITRAELRGASGLLTYTIDTALGRMTRKMLVTR